MAVRLGTSFDDMIDAADTDDVLAGFSGNDRIETGAGDDLVFGGIGDDTIIAGTGFNMVFGGADRDVFVFTPDSAGMTLIGDFEDGLDRIDLSQLGITGFSQLDIEMNSRGAIIAIGGLVINLRTDDAAGLGAEDFIFAQPPGARILDFEDVAHDDGYAALITDAYAGFTWTNFGVLETDEYSAEKVSGYRARDGDNLLYNGFGDPAAFARTENFDLESLWLSAAWSDGLNVTIEAWDDGALLGRQVVTLAYGVSALFELDDALFDSVDEVRFVASGGQDVTTDEGTGSHFGLDQMTLIG